MLYCLYTLVDITATGHHRSGERIERNQQQNFDTITQTIQLAGNMYYDKKPIIISADLFGQPNNRCWFFEWTMELDELFYKDNDNIGRLKDMFEYVPFIAGLTESVQFDKAYFKLGTNIIFDFKL